jgi:hypothetical protein
MGKGEIIITSSEEESDSEDRAFIEQSELPDSDEFLGVITDESEEDYDWADDSDEIDNFIPA